MTDTAPFAQGQVLRSRLDGRRYVVTRPYVPPKAVGCFDLDCFEVMCIDPPKPFLQAASLAEDYEPISGDRAVVDASPKGS